MCTRITLTDLKRNQATLTQLTINQSQQGQCWLSFMVSIVWLNYTCNDETNFTDALGAHCISNKVQDYTH